ncbi:Nudix hydrolase 3 [Phytophthora pseudosyringae]|uniref:Nudix hydrolase 3 n=1 Tax=Phytophthora pseudosyringae TaxID=221518 RepID=A0A8T1VWU3_9STRA|nr:Nudix hydrolase 3 [Phytophthora pseudosyringae]
MRVLSLVALVTFLSAACVAADSDKTRIAADVDIVSRELASGPKQVKRSLRRYEADGEERILPGLEKLDDVMSKVTKVDDIAAKAANPSGKLSTLVRKNKGNLAEYAALVKKLSTSKVYKDVNLDTMSLSVLRQMDDVEKVRAVDIKNGLKGTKATADGMRRKMEPFPGMKIAPEQYLASHVGRHTQRYGKDGSRWLSSAVVSRPAEQGGGQVLLISSSNPKKGDWLLPKGGWDQGESIKKSALREVIEEGGVNAQLAHGLGKVKFSEGKSKYTYFAYLMKGGTVYDDWSESVRYRLFVSYDEAMVLLANRPRMVEVVRRAKAVDSKIVAGKMPALDPKLSKVTLD